MGYFHINKSGIPPINGTTYGNYSVKWSHLLAIETQQDIRENAREPLLFLQNFGGYINFVALFAAIHETYATTILQALEEDRKKIESGIIAGISSILDPNGKKISEGFQDYCYSRVVHFSEAIKKDIDIGLALNLEPFTNPNICGIAREFMESLNVLWEDEPIKITENERILVLEKITILPKIYFTEISRNVFEYTTD